MVLSKRFQIIIQISLYLHPNNPRASWFPLSENYPSSVFKPFTSPKQESSPLNLLAYQFPPHAHRPVIYHLTANLFLMEGISDRFIIFLWSDVIIPDQHPLVGR